MAMADCSSNRTAARHKTSPETWEQVKVAYTSGVGLSEIARKMQIPPGTVLARAKREGWTRQILAVKQQSKLQSNAITPAEAAADVLSERKDKSRLHLSRYVVDASRTSANSDGDLKIARNVKDVAVHSTLWPEQQAQGSGVLPGLSVYSKQTVINVDKRKSDSGAS
jgi:hypothetical protein